MLKDVETVNRIVEMWNAGKSAGEIAHHFKVTRNQVMGKVSRLRKEGVFLRTAASPLARVKVIEVKTDRGWKKRKDTTRPPVAVSLKPIEQFVFDFGPVETNIDILQLTPHSCRYIVGEDRRRGALYCGEPKSYRSYCETHAKLCYVMTKQPQASRPSEDHATGPAVGSDEGRGSPGADSD